MNIADESEIGHRMVACYIDDGGRICACGADKDHVECWSCGGEGWEDRYDEDPLWYGHDLWRCSNCDGLGGWWICSTSTDPGDLVGA